MKIVKMSLAAAMLMGASAFAVENVQISGDANVFYSTQDAVVGALNNQDADQLFDKDTSAADASLNLNLTADLYKNDLVSISAAAGYTAISTLGLENNFVGSVWGGSHAPTAATGANFPTNATAVLDAPGVKVENASWFTEAYAVVAAGNTAAKVGRMALDTPLAFTETWSIEKNTFEGAAVINQDIPGTTVVLAWVGNGNGNEQFGQNLSGNEDDVLDGTPGILRAAGHTVGAVVNEDGKFATYGTDGAYAAGIVNSSLEMLTLQAWYYDVTRLAQAYWIQADFSMMGILAGVQYSALEVDADNTNEDNIVAAMVGYEMKDVVTVKAAFSQTNDDGTLGSLGGPAAGFNTATSTGASKIYTESWLTYGYITQIDTTSFSVSAEGSVPNIVDLGLYYTMADQSDDAGNNDMSEITLTASKSFGPLDLTLAYINTDLEKAEDPVNTVQGFITLNF